MSIRRHRRCSVWVVRTAVVRAECGGEGVDGGGSVVVRRRCARLPRAGRLVYPLLPESVEQTLSRNSVVSRSIPKYP